MDKEIFKFTVLWAGWECDSDAWIMERPDGTRYLRMTNHDEEYEAKLEELHARISEYEAVIAQSRKALAMLVHNVKLTGGLTAESEKKNE